MCAFIITDKGGPRMKEKMFTTQRKRGREKIQKERNQVHDTTNEFAGKFCGTSRMTVSTSRVTVGIPNANTACGDCIGTFSQALLLFRIVLGLLQRNVVDWLVSFFVDCAAIILSLSMTRLTQGTRPYYFRNSRSTMTHLFREHKILISLRDGQSQNETSKTKIRSVDDPIVRLFPSSQYSF